MMSPNVVLALDVEVILTAVYAPATILRGQQ